LKPVAFLDGRVNLFAGDCLDVLAGLPENSVDSVVCDPPYHLTSIVKRFGGDNAAEAKVGKTGAYARASAGFMGKKWDGGDIAFRPETWAAVLRVMKPGAHLLAFSGTRTYHRMVCAIEDAGFEIRDQIAWLYGSGFPKSHDVSKGIDKDAGHWRGRAGAITIASQVAKGTEYERSDKGEPITAAALQWQGWGSALKPALEPIVLARKPLTGTIAANVLRWGTGALNIDGCRVGDDEIIIRGGGGGPGTGWGEKREINVGRVGRFPANLIHDGSEEVLEAFPETGAARTGERNPNGKRDTNAFGDYNGQPGVIGGHNDDGGSAARFFYSAKADSMDRIASKHPTVKPLDLMQYLCRLITPPGGTVLDCFAGTGTTGEAAWREGFNAILIEREEEYQADIARRMDLAVKPGKRAAVAKTKGKLMGAEGTPLFGGTAEYAGGHGRMIYGHFRDQDERLARLASKDED
jgi:site-specific DNA-methyltransferase (adenine-specific)